MNDTWRRRDRLYDSLSAVLSTVLVGAAGGGVFAFLGLPAAWLSGAMVAVAAYAVSGRGRPVPTQLRDVAFVFLGVSMGAGVSPEALDGITRWPLSVVVLIGVQPFVIGLVALYLNRHVGWSRSTSLFSAIPGALSYVVAVADQSDADMRKVTVAQTVRVFILVASLPSLITFLLGDTPAMPVKATPDIGPALIQLAAGVFGALLFRRLNVPAATLIGAFFASALLHGADIIDGRLPDYLLVPGLVVIGSMLGSRFAGTSLATLRLFLAPALVAFAIAMAINSVAAVAVSALIGVPVAQTLLAFAPGGLDAMTVMAFTLALDPAFVAAHHLSRFLLMVLFLPLMAQWLLKRGGEREI